VAPIADRERGADAVTAPPGKVFLINLKEVLLSPSAAVCLTGQEGAADNPL